MSQHIVIVGAGQCGAAAAQTLRAEGFEGHITLVGDEHHPPYERPPLSKSYLQGKQLAEDLLVQPRGWYRDQGLELRTGARVVAVSPAGSLVSLDDGTSLSYDQLLVATGGRPRRLPFSSARIRYLRTLDDAECLASDLSSARRIVVIGAGFIGAEVAASARQLGVEVTILEVQSMPLARVLGPVVGHVYAAIHRDEGVDLRCDDGVEDIIDTGESLVVHTTRGQTLECDVVAVGIGIEPNTEFLANTGVDLSNGIRVDEFGRTALADIYAAGDVANHFHPVFDRHVRVEHYDNALRHGQAVARSMLGRGEPFDDPHWFWSDQYGYNLQSVGLPDGCEDVIIRGSMEERRFLAFYLRDDRITAVAGINAGQEVLRAKRLVQRRAAIEQAHLRDPETDLRALGRSA